MILIDLDFGCSFSGFSFSHWPSILIRPGERASKPPQRTRQWPAVYYDAVAAAAAGLRRGRDGGLPAGREAAADGLRAPHPPGEALIIITTITIQKALIIVTTITIPYYSKGSGVIAAAAASCTPPSRRGRMAPITDNDIIMTLIT